MGNSLSLAFSRVAVTAPLSVLVSSTVSAATVTCCVTAPVVIRALMTPVWAVWSSMVWLAVFMPGAVTDTT